MAYNRLHLWELTRDPKLVAFFKRGASDNGLASLASNPLPDILDGGALADIERDARRDAFSALSADIGRGDRFAARVLEDA